MRYGFALLAVVSTCSILPASSQECDPEISLASLHGAYKVGLVQHRVESDRSSASVKEAIERNREDRERTVVIER